MARYLNPPVAPAVVVQGDNLEVVADLRKPVEPKPSLVFGIYNEQYGAAGSFTVGPLSPGRHEYLASLPGDCVSACRLDSITAAWPGPSSPGSAQQSAWIPSKSSESRREDRTGLYPVEAGLSHAGWWRVTQGAPGRALDDLKLAVWPAGLVRLRGRPGTPGRRPRRRAEHLPAVVTDTVASLQAGGPTARPGTRCSTSTGAFSPSTGPCTWPRSRRWARTLVMVDLTDALRDESLPDNDSEEAGLAVAGDRLGRSDRRAPAQERGIRVFR